MNYVAFTVKVVKSEKRLLDDPFRESNWEGTASIGSKLSKGNQALSKNVGHKADVGAVVALSKEHIIKLKAVFEAWVVWVGRLDGLENIHLA